MNKEFEKKNKSLILDLYRVALSDGELSSEEQLMLNKIALENDLSVDELSKVLKVKPEAKSIPNEEGEKRKYLFDIARLIIADGRIREEELYLFDRIMTVLKINNSTNELLKKEIFNQVIKEHIDKEERRILDLKNRLSIELETKINCKTIKLLPEDEVKQLIDELKAGYESGLYGVGYVKKPNILLLGSFNQDKQFIKKLVSKAFKDNGIDLGSKSLRTCIGDFDKVKNNFSRVNQSLANGTIDYFIYGPHPHHLNGKSNEESWEMHLKDTAIQVKGDYNKVLSVEKIKSIANSFAKHWVSN